MWVDGTINSAVLSNGDELSSFAKDKIQSNICLAFNNGQLSLVDCDSKLDFACQVIIHVALSK